VIRGEIWTVQDNQYASKPRPTVIVSVDSLKTDSVIVVMTTSEANTDIPQRVKLEPNPENGLRNTCYAMADKPMALRRQYLGYRIGKLNDTQMSQIAKGLASAMGITVNDLS
jgi:mRNA interferase MazF